MNYSEYFDWMCGIFSNDALFEEAEIGQAFYVPWLTMTLDKSSYHGARGFRKQTASDEEFEERLRAKWTLQPKLAGVNLMLQIVPNGPLTQNELRLLGELSRGNTLRSRSELLDFLGPNGMSASTIGQKERPLHLRLETAASNQFELSPLSRSYLAVQPENIRRFMTERYASSLSRAPVNTHEAKQVSEFIKSFEESPSVETFISKLKEWNDNRFSDCINREIGPLLLFKKAKKENKHYFFLYSPSANQHVKLIFARELVPLVPLQKLENFNLLMKTYIAENLNLEEHYRRVFEYAIRPGD